MEHLWRIGLLIERSRAFGRELCEGIVTYAQDRPWEMRYLSPEDIHPARLSDIDGFIARVTTPAIARALAATGKPVVDVFYSFPDYGFSIVKERHETIGRLAAEHFLNRKFRNFAYCPFGDGKTSAYCRTAFILRLRHEGFACNVFASTADVGYTTDGRAVIGDRIAKPKDAKALRKWLKSLRRPVAVFAPDDLRAWQVLETCREIGLSVPADVAVLGLDNDLLICGCTRPMLSSIDPNTHEIGRTAAETLETLFTSHGTNASSARSNRAASSHANPRRSIPSNPTGCPMRSSTSTERRRTAFRPGDHRVTPQCYSASDTVPD